MATTRVTAALAAHRRAERQLERTRAELHAAILAELTAGDRGTQADLARETGYSRERIRQLAREAEARASA